MPGSVAKPRNDTGAPGAGLPEAVTAPMTGGALATVIVVESDTDPPGSATVTVATYVPLSG